MFQLLLPVIYLSFISLGLPDSLLGAVWPSMYQQLSVPFSFAGILSMIIAVGTVVSSLQSHRFTKRYGTGKVTAVSVLVTALSLLGFSFSHSYWLLCLWAVPYGLGAGGVDASLNNYVALHYKSRHMSWLHCMWGIGASLGPAVMGGCAGEWRKMECGLSVYWDPSDHPDCASVFQPASLEEGWRKAAGADGYGTGAGSSVFEEDYKKKGYKRSNDRFLLL